MTTARDVEEIRKRLDGHDQELKDLAARTGKLETSDAVRSERHKTVIARLDKIDGHVSKLMWLVIAGIVGAFLQFVFRGGLNNVGG